MITRMLAISQNILALILIGISLLACSNEEKDFLDLMTHLEIDEDTIAIRKREYIMHEDGKTISWKTASWTYDFELTKLQRMQFNPYQGHGQDIYRAYYIYKPNKHNYRNSLVMLFKFGTLTAGDSPDNEYLYLFLSDIMQVEDYIDYIDYMDLLDINKETLEYIRSDAACLYLGKAKYKGYKRYTKPGEWILE